MATADGMPAYAARLDIEYTEQRNRLTVAFRLILAIPILILSSLLEQAIGLALVFATLLMILLRQRYPRWWFDFVYAYTRFSTRVSAYLGVLVDEYPSTEDEQRVHLELDYPDAKALGRWLPLIKWLLVIPHLIVLIVLFVLAIFAMIIAWFAILITGRYPRGLFNFTVGVNRWWLRVNAYALLLITDRYPPFRLDA